MHISPHSAPPSDRHDAPRGAGRGLDRLVREQEGVAAIEFAILLPVLCAILLGMIDYGYYFFLKSTVVNAAREGARAGVVVTTSEADAEALAVAVATTYLNNANVGVGGCFNCADAPVATYDTGTGLLSVQVNVDFAALTGFLPAAALPATATHTSVMRAEGLLP